MRWQAIRVDSLFFHYRIQIRCLWGVIFSAKCYNELRKNITSLYDVVNDISRNLSSKELKEINIFYTQKELKKVETI